MSFVTAHVLDASLGTPAPGVTITLQRDDNTEIAQASRMLMAVCPNWAQKPWRPVYTGSPLEPANTLAAVMSKPSTPRSS